jgi:hypothetical protein
VHELDFVPAVVEQRGQAPPNAQVELHPGILGVLGVHVVTFFVGHHLECQLVVVAQKEAPLARLGYLRGVL